MSLGAKIAIIMVGTLALANSYNIKKHVLNKQVKYRTVETEKDFDSKALMEANVVIRTRTGKGSGSIIKVEDNKSYILTAAHVVSKKRPILETAGKLGTKNVKEKDITVIFKETKEYKANIVKIDYKLDVAVLKVYRNLPTTPVVIADSSPELGDAVWSLSNPGMHVNLINKGIFSDREYNWNYAALGGYFGSSGGMCVNNRGEQIGVISTVVTTSLDRFFPTITIYNGITKTSNLNKFLRGIL